MKSTAPLTTELPTPPASALTVAAVVARIKLLIERQFPSPVWIEGELSNCKYHTSGHIYFTLGDEQATDRFGNKIVLPCAFFRNANQHLKFTLEDGMKVLCYGQVTTYEGRAQYQLRVLRVEPKGVGALQLAFDQLKKRLAAQGLFDEARKRPIPKLPERVGVVTSATGSVIHDMVSKLRGHVHVIILPVKVQGEGAAKEIVHAIHVANAKRLADVLIVGRGGGSIEDLWAFNEEAVAHAIFGSTIPVISAVGHEDHWTIADYTADLRASTPTDAAKQLVQAQAEFVEQCRESVDRLLDTMQGVLDDHTQRLGVLGEQLRLLHPKRLLEQHLRQAQELQRQLVQSTRFALESCAHHLQGLAGRLQALSPLAVLARGYSITLKLPSRRVVTSTAGLRVGDALETLVAHGRLESAVTRTTGPGDTSIFPRQTE